MSEEDLRFNTLNHELVPFHEVVDENDVAPLLQQYGIVKEQLPKIRDDDPAARVIEAKPGQVVRITRESPTAGRHTAYRLVVAAP